MARNIVPINNKEHANLKLLPRLSLAHVEHEHILPVTVHEFVPLAGDFPIAFAKHPTTGEFNATGMLGFKPGENYFVRDGEWKGQIPPGVVTIYPFCLFPHPNDEKQMFVGADMDSELFDVNEGQPLFNEDGSETESFTARKTNVTNYYEHTQITNLFCALLNDMGLLEPKTLTMDLDGEKAGVDGIYLVSEEKLNALPDEKFLDLKARGFLPAIYAHIASINQVRRLALMRKEKLEG